MCCVRAGHVAAGGSLPGQQARATSKPHVSSKKITKNSEGGNLRDILVCADHVWRKYLNSPGSSKTPDAHNSALNDQYRDISELRHAKVVVKVDSIHGRNQGVACVRPVSHRTRLVFSFPEKTLWRMACFAIAVVPDSTDVIVCRPREIGRIGTQLTKICLCCFVLDVLLVANCSLIISPMYQ